MHQHPWPVRPCEICHQPLAPLEQFGPDVQITLCWEHYAEWCHSQGTEDSWYGLGPHTHAFDADGQIVIGGTQFLPLPAPNAQGEYEIDGYLFVPDPECPGCGVWSTKPLPGWL